MKPALRVVGRFRGCGSLGPRLGRPGRTRSRTMTTRCQGGSRTDTPEGSCGNSGVVRAWGGPPLQPCLCFLHYTSRPAQNPKHPCAMAVKGFDTVRHATMDAIDLGRGSFGNPWLSPWVEPPTMSTREADRRVIRASVRQTRRRRRSRHQRTTLFTQACRPHPQRRSLRRGKGSGRLLCRTRSGGSRGRPRKGRRHKRVGAPLLAGVSLHLPPIASSR